MIKVSVIIPVYNAEKYLEESLYSIFNQTLDDIEIICVDDGSTDSSWKMLNDFADTHENMKIFHQENKGAGAARNYALNHVEGKYFYFMDVDDILDLNALKEFYEISEEKNLDFLVFKAINYDEDTDSFYEISNYSMEDFYEFVGNQVVSFEDLGYYAFRINVSPWCKFYNSEFVLSTGAKFAEGLIFEDNIFYWDMVFHAKRIYFYNKFLYIRRRHSKSAMGAGDQRFAGTIKINNLMIQQFIDNGYFDEYEVRLYNRKFMFTLLRYEQLQDQYREYYYNVVKEDFCKLICHERYDDCISKFNILYTNLFESFVYSNNFEEFEGLLEDTLIKRDNNTLYFEITKLDELNDYLDNLETWNHISS